MNNEYVSNPRLALLAEELQILNEKLINLNLPDSVRLFRMRNFAEASSQITNISIPRMQFTDDRSNDLFWAVAFKGKHLGDFQTQTQAHEAYRNAHIEHYGIKSKYHSDFRLDVSHLYDLDNLPTGIRFNSDGTFQVRIYANDKRINAGSFSTLPEAEAAYQAAHAELHGQASPFYEQQKAAA